MKKLLLVLMSLMLLSCTSATNYLTGEGEIVVPTFLIQNAMKEKFPIDKDLLIGSVELKNPVVALKNDKMNIGLDLNINGPSGFDLEGGLTLASGIRYDAEKREIFLKDVNILSLNSNGEEYSNSNYIDIAENLLAAYFDREPAYELKDKYSDKMIDTIIIEDSKLKVNLVK